MQRLLAFFLIFLSTIHVCTFVTTAHAGEMESFTIGGTRQLSSKIDTIYVIALGEIIERAKIENEFEIILNKIGIKTVKSTLYNSDLGNINKDNISSVFNKDAAKLSQAIVIVSNTQISANEYCRPEECITIYGNVVDIILIDVSTMETLTSTRVTISQKENALPKWITGKDTQNTIFKKVIRKWLKDKNVKMYLNTIK